MFNVAAFSKKMASYFLGFLGSGWIQIRKA
jgi:hypothetical protein